MSEAGANGRRRYPYVITRATSHSKQFCIETVNEYKMLNLTLNFKSATWITLTSICMLHLIVTLVASEALTVLKGGRWIADAWFEIINLNNPMYIFCNHLVQIMLPCLCYNFLLGFVIVRWKNCVILHASSRSTQFFTSYSRNRREVINPSPVLVRAWGRREQR